MFDVIERLKAEWTDKYVVVDARAPELARFAEATGQVRTVNMNGRCLVEFAQFNNTGWYDIDPSRLKVVPKPIAPPEGEKPQAKASPKAASGDAPKPASKTAGKPAPAAGKPSTADILAAARAKGGAPAPAKPAAAKPSTAEILAAARAKGGAGAPPATTPAGDTSPSAAGRPSTAEILARARAGKAAAQEPASQPDDDAQETAVPEATADPVPTPKAAKAPAGGSPLPTTTAEKIAWCRAHDAQG